MDKRRLGFWIGGALKTIAAKGLDQGRRGLGFWNGSFTAHRWLSQRERPTFFCTILRGTVLVVDVPAMTDGDYEHQKLCVFELAENAVIADAVTP